MHQLRVGTARSRSDRCGSPPERTRFPRTSLTGPPARLLPPRLTSARARAGLPYLLAPVTVSLAAIGATLAGLSAAAVLLVSATVAVLGALLAHRALGRLLAGAVLLLARPFAPGDRLRLHVPELGGPVDGELLRIGLLTATLCTDSGVLVVPTGELLRAPHR